jgi:hypothetical protein
MRNKKSGLSFEQIFYNMFSQGTRPFTEFEMFELDGSLWLQEKKSCKKK